MSNPELHVIEVPDQPIDIAPTGFWPEWVQTEILRNTLTDAGINLGDYDERVLSWLATWDWPVVATVSSWIRRAVDEQDTRTGGGAG